MIDKRRVQSMLRKVPWAWNFAQRLYRRTQPRVTAGVVGVVINHVGQVLLVEHVFHIDYPWGLPGGWMARGEEPADTIRREVREETGLRIEPVRPLLIIRSPVITGHLDISYLCYAPPDAGEVRLSEELLDFRWQDPGQPVTERLIIFHRQSLEVAVAERLMNAPRQTFQSSDDR